MTDRWKLVVYQNIQDVELYDHVEAPGQRRNLWTVPDDASTRAELLHRLSQEQLRRDGWQPPRIANA